jgi:hypothetical protein
MLQFFHELQLQNKNLLAGIAVFANIIWRDSRSAYTNVISRCHRFEVKGCQGLVHQAFRL